MKTLLLSFLLLSFLASCSEEKTDEVKEDTQVEEKESDATEVVVAEVDVEQKYFLHMSDSITAKGIGPTLSEIFPAVMNHAMKNNASPSMPVAVYNGFDPKDLSATFVLDAGVFLNDSIVPGENMSIDKFYKGKALMAVHVGSYENLSATYEAIFKFAGENSLTPVGEGWEIYANDPMEVGMENAKTEVYIPIE